ncbi:MAG: helix-turn-helix transcriptional regulator [Proteobacteria bacterium]|nr:helix-turn-helix transcriptional regulator [Pseudomonadota bacterium]
MAKTEAEKYLEENYGRLTFARALRADRMANEMTQQMLADKLKLSKQAISKYEKGIDFPTSDTVKSMAKFFGMSYAVYVELILQDFAAKKGFGLVSVKAEDIKPKKKKSA